MERVTHDGDAIGIEATKNLENGKAEVEEKCDFQIANRAMVVMEMIVAMVMLMVMLMVMVMVMPIGMLVPRLAFYMIVLRFCHIQS
jgi:hypothetical protein